MSMNADDASISPIPGSTGVPPSHGALPCGTCLQEFEVTGVVGEGGFGIVYLAQDKQLNRTVAVKEYMPASLASRDSGKSVVVRSERYLDTFEAGKRSFIAEARMLAQFKHPALVEVFRFWEQNGTVYMAMPFYRGKTLREVLKNGAVADERWLKSLLGPLMDALEMMHDQNVYHRDIAPDNILVLTNGAPVLLDLGAARRIISDLTEAVTVVLKPGYAPIEQYAADMTSRQGPWTDIYGLAAVVYFAITGKAPVASVSRIMKDSLVPLRSLDYPAFSEEFLAAINHALAVKPEDRPQNIAEFREMLGVASFVPPTTMASYRSETEQKSKPSPASDPLEALVPKVTVSPCSVEMSAPTLGADPVARDSADFSSPVEAQQVPEVFADPDSTVLADSFSETGNSVGELDEVPEGGPAPESRRNWRRPAVFASALMVLLLAVGGAVFWGGFLEAATPVAPPPPAQSVPALAVPAPVASAPEQSSPPVVQPSSVPTEDLAQSRPAEEGQATVARAENEDVKAEQAAPAAKGKLRFVLRPWGDVWVNGVSKGPCPPLKELVLPEGEYKIELRNPGFAPVNRVLTIRKGATLVVEHHFE